MAIRIHGTLAKWNEERGFGFISLAEGKGDVFVHISAFPRDGRRPQVNELISCELEPGPDGRMRAVRIMRPGQQHIAPRRRGIEKRSRGWKGLAEAAIGLLFVIALGTYGYSLFNGAGRTAPEARQAMRTEAPLPGDSSFQCDGRTLCSQMTSCAEARYFVRHCPNTKMDGNGDGEPCEQQWCD